MSSENVKIYRDIARVEADLVAQLLGLAVADLYDAFWPAVEAVGLIERTLQPITPGLRAHGQAITAFCSPGDSLMSHCALYLARPGDIVVVCNGGVPNGALWGGNMALDAKKLGIAGVVVDGPVRDVAFIRELGVPTWASSISVSKAEKIGRGSVNLPVRCGAVTVNPGDIVVADDDGVLAFSPNHIQRVVAEVRKRLQDEHPMRRRIQDGERVFDIVGLQEVLDSHDIEVHDGNWKKE